MLFALLVSVCGPAQPCFSWFNVRSASLCEAGDAEPRRRHAWADVGKDSAARRYGEGRFSNDF